MNSYLKLKKSNCKNCYKCIRHCPVKSIKFSDNQANIVSDECILCGECFRACPQNAKEIRNDTDKVKALIAKNEVVYVSLAPSFVANYEGATVTTLEKALKKLGFFAVEETAIGATIVKKGYEEMVSNNTNDVIISSCCHTVNLLIQKYYPEVLPNLANILSPMQAHCTDIKKRNPKAKTVFIGPCISKKEEADRYTGIVDVALTFEELTNWFNEEHILLEQGKDEVEESKARLFPIAGGILKTMVCDNKDYNYITIDGLENCISALKDIAKGKVNGKCFIEMSACKGSCIGGPAMDKGRYSPINDMNTISNYAGEKDFSVPKKTLDELYKNMPFFGVSKQMPGSVAIEEILKKMGKHTIEDQLNCGSCGYDTCREKAIAVINGKADLTMCLPFLKEKAESFSDKIINNTPNGIIVLNEDLEVQQINKAACAILNLKAAKNILGDNVVRILEPGAFADVLISGDNIYDKRIYLAEYNKYVDETIIYDKDYHILMAIMRDVTSLENYELNKEKVNRKAIEITDKVIDKQMRIVQEIALLLGETTAETKVALTNLKESLKSE
ncbi:MAG: [Fe-Fe] hydrogenase large subunit C-terminal domain-containing protein [Clostridia bacterium]